MSNLDIYNIVRVVPEEAKKPIEGGRLSGMTDINPMWRIKTLTEQFGVCGIGWYTEIVNKEIYPVGEEIIVSVDCNLYIKIDGEWSKPISGTGGSKLISAESKGLFNDDEAFKKAETDAISVCCKKLGIGADVYWNKDGESKYTPAERQNKFEYKCEGCGKTIEKVVKDGEYISPSEIARKSKELTKTTYGSEHILCSSCIRDKETIQRVIKG